VVCDLICEDESIDNLTAKVENSNDYPIEDINTIDFKVHPIPFDDFVTVDYSLGFDSEVTIDIYNIHGVLVKQILRTNKVIDQNQSMNIDLSNVANQLLFIKMTTNKGSVTKKIISNR
jgi:hypothetical protein